ncbi:MAG: hypothetical protein A2206_00995 [Candidatus Magasanikbacteria bacterium RIFOXYA1_FULL_40_8]|uniref:Trimeric autotransporter adhesin YadA-like head domain-containing protein n=1 Tax=Candidatus Magasanikbacteria bacterium RIFOXYA1_FULL_40_8 TaxID=1798694 RepID=A0A1F6NUX5_9BACT|nr:MAG: hypothetical protein A2206_00995 [Candidatus Magasanikbacteria bacterium RIFOXYA1_FULL_40_8]
MGGYTLFNNTTAGYNVALGNDAGRYIANGEGANSLTSTSVYIGAQTKSSISGAYNENVFGYGAIGMGSSTVVLGNDYILKTYLKGIVNVSSTTWLTGVTTTMIEPWLNNTYDFGSYGKAWKSLYASSSAYLSFVSTTMIEPFTNNVSPLGSFGKAWSNLFASGTAYLANVTISDTLTLASSTNPTIDATGEIGINTTNASSSVRYHDGTAERALYSVDYRTITIVSSTLDAYEGKTNSSTIPIGVASVHGETWTDMICFTDSGTAEVEFGDGTNWMDYYKATTATTTRDTSLSNNAFEMLEKRYIRVGKLVTADSITCSVGIRETAD